MKGQKTTYRGGPYRSGTATVKDRRGQIAPSPAGGVTSSSMSVAVAVPDRGRLVPKGHAKGGEPGGAGTAKYRVQRFERHGPSFRVVIPLRGGVPTATASGVNYPPAAATQANGRVLPARTKREVWSGADFWETGLDKY